jgi:myo-inositol catabolism protein IolC
VRREEREFVSDERAERWADRLAAKACNAYHERVCPMGVPCDWWAVAEEAVRSTWREVVRAVLQEVVAGSDELRSKAKESGQ